MRVLDLGAGDGYLTHWLREQIPGLIVDAIELDENAARTARDRLNGAVVIGRAEDAPRLLPKRSYDAVIAFEVFEHVPDTSLLLDACEQMLKPGGLVYVSTPDGTYGQGGNPHHLRAMRAIDFADTLRRRGTLRDMTVGRDGVTVASYQPRARREDIALYLGPCWQKWSPMDIETKGLGGSETAAVRLANALSDLGFVVTVYGDTGPTCLKDVVFRPHYTFDPAERRDCVIASRIPEVGDRLINARTRLLWTHDTDYGPRLTWKRSRAFDAVLTLSRWHTDHVAGLYPFLRDHGKLVQARNGIHLPYFQERTPWEERPQRAVYSSSPDRGLDILLEMWPSIRERVPDAELWTCYPDVYDAVADQNPEVAKHRQRVHELADQPGVTRLGGLPQPKLAQLLCDSRVWAHPSWVSMHQVPFHETSCIGAMEAQAAGAYVVAADWGALSETVQVGARVSGSQEKLSRRWRESFQREIVRGLTVTEAGEWATSAGPSHARSLGWEGVASGIAALMYANR